MIAITVISIAVVMVAFCTCVYVVNEVQFKKSRIKLYMTAVLIAVFGAIITALVSTI